VKHARHRHQAGGEIGGLVGGDCQHPRATRQLFAQPDALLETLLEAHLAAAEALACDESGACILWAREDGEAAFQLTASLKLAAKIRSHRTGSDPLCSAVWR
jgi:hypothetical protein